MIQLLKSQNNNISLNSPLLQKTKIKKRYLFMYLPKKVSIVELNKHNPNGLASLSYVVKKWGKYSKIRHILANDNPKEKIICLTTQKKDYENINPQKILALMKIFNKTGLDGNDVLWIDQLQIRNDARYIPEDERHLINENNLCLNRISRKYKDIGTKLFEYIKSIRDNKEILFFATHNAIPFFEKNNFKHKPNLYYYMFFK